MELLRRNGILAGLNLREVAEEAGVNRGLVYHYFGSRRDLLRSALGRDLKTRLGAITSTANHPLKVRIGELLRSMVRTADHVRIAALLFLDGDRSVRFMPLRDEWLKMLDDDIARKDLGEDVDTRALLGIITALSHGYALFRAPIAKELGMGVREMDERVESLLADLIQGTTA